MMLHRMALSLTLAFAAAWPIVAAVTEPQRGLRSVVFSGIDGDTIALADFAGRPVLIVNTASRCGYVDQLDGLQALYDRYRARGLAVIGVPSNSFRQELADAEAVKTFCEVNFSLDFPMATITEVRGPEAHPFYRWAAEQGVEPQWNFHKILVDGEGRLVGSFPATVAPDAPELLAAIEAALPQP